METRYKLKSFRGLCMLVFALILSTNTQAQTQTTTVTECDEYTWAVDGVTYTSSIVLPYTDLNGTTYLLDLTLGYSITSTELGTTSCGSWSYGDSTWTDAGQYYYYDVTPEGCQDSVAITITSGSSVTYSANETLYLCNEYYSNDDEHGIRYFDEDTVITETYYGPWANALTGSSGCDSIVLVDLILFNPIQEGALELCLQNNVDSFELPGNLTYVYETGLYSDTVYTGSASPRPAYDLGICDEFIITDWQINFNITSSEEDYHSCASATNDGAYVWNGITCDTEGAYTYTTNNDNGCEHIATLNFTLGMDTDPTAEEVSGEVTWTDPIGNIYTESGTYTVNIGNEDGCAAFVTYLVTINPDILGCMDADNCNYDSTATADDGSCYVINAPVQQEGILTEENLNEVNWYTDADGSRWNMNDDATVPQSLFAPVSSCNYYIGWMDDMGCETFSEPYAFARMAGNIGEITTYPNPVKDIVSLRFNNFKNQNVKFELIDNNGTKVADFITPNNALDIDLRKYPSGVYYISFDSTNNKEEGCITQEKQKTVTKIILNK